MLKVAENSNLVPGWRKDLKDLLPEEEVEINE